MKIFQKDIEEKLGKPDEKINLEIEKIIKRQRGNDLVSINIG